ncbi:MAG: C40 family peptidase [Sporichthyaceae bacterium]|nr:C40 family peptidase [Sporichthyaceae bacterium]
MSAGYTLSPAAPRASAAVISAAKADAAVEWARSRKGSPYGYGADGPNRFDCSGLTRWVYSRVGRSLPHSSSAQVSRTERIRKENRRRGDLVFFYSHGGIYHVAIYPGRGYIWHASRPGTPVQRVKPWTSSLFYGRVK